MIYKSIHHGNTEKVAKSIAEVLQADLRESNEVNKEEVLRNDLVGFGSGIYRGSFHEDILNLVDELPEVESKKSFLFSTSGFPKIPIFHNFWSKIKKKLEEKGFEVVGHFSCRGWNTNLPGFDYFGGVYKGRPNEEDLEQAKKIR